METTTTKRDRDAMRKAEIRTLERAAREVATAATLTTNGVREVLNSLALEIVDRSGPRTALHAYRRIAGMLMEKELGEPVAVCLKSALRAVEVFAPESLRNEVQEVTTMETKTTMEQEIASGAAPIEAETAQQPNEQAQQAETQPKPSKDLYPLKFREGSAGALLLTALQQGKFTKEQLAKVVTDAGFKASMVAEVLWRARRAGKLVEISEDGVDKYSVSL